MFARLASTARPALAAAFVGSGAAASCLRIEEETKLDFKDVLIRPKRSTLKSRSEVTLARRPRGERLRRARRVARATPRYRRHRRTLGRRGA